MASHPLTTHNDIPHSRPKRSHITQFLMVETAASIGLTPAEGCDAFKALRDCLHKPDKKAETFRLGDLCLDAVTTQVEKGSHRGKTIAELMKAFGVHFF